MQSRPMLHDGIALARAACVDVVEHTSHARRRDGGQKEVRRKIRKSEVWTRSEQDRRECNASPQEGHAQERPWRQGRNGEEPEAGDRDRSLGGAEEGREGPAQEQLPEELIPQELAKGRPEELAQELEEALVVATPHRDVDGAGACSMIARRRRRRVAGLAAMQRAAHALPIAN